MKTVHTYMRKQDGTRTRSVDWSDKVEVQVSSCYGAADDADIAKAAEQIADFARVVERHEAEVLQFRGQEADLRKQLAEAKRQIPPKTPARLLGTGYVRFADGKPVLLNRRERGFGEFGFTCESWDQLFREFDVRITAHGVDEHGPWWAAETVSAAGGQGGGE